MSEFESFYSELPYEKDCSREDYFYYFLRYKIKVFDAKRLEIDKSSEFINEANLLNQCLHDVRMQKKSFEY